MTRQATEYYLKVYHTIPYLYHTCRYCITFSVVAYDEVRFHHVRLMLTYCRVAEREREREDLFWLLLLLLLASLRIFTIVRYSFFSSFSSFSYHSYPSSPSSPSSLPFFIFTLSLKATSPLVTLSTNSSSGSKSKT